MSRVVIGRVEPDRESCVPRVARQRLLPEGKQRPDEGTAHGGHPRESRWTGTGQQAHQNRLDLVVGVMGREYAVSPLAHPRGLEPGVARRAGDSLSRAGTERTAAALEREA